MANLSNSCPEGFVWDPITQTCVAKDSLGTVQQTAKYTGKYPKLFHKGQEFKRKANQLAKDFDIGKRIKSLSSNKEKTIKQNLKRKKKEYKKQFKELEKVDKIGSRYLKKIDPKYLDYTVGGLEDYGQYIDPYTRGYLMSKPDYKPEEEKTLNPYSILNTRQGYSAIRDARNKGKISQREWRNYLENYGGRKFDPLRYDLTPEQQKRWEQEWGRPGEMTDFTNKIGSLMNTTMQGLALGSAFMGATPTTRSISALARNPNTPSLRNIIGRNIANSDLTRATITGAKNLWNKPILRSPVTVGDAVNLGFGAYYGPKIPEAIKEGNYGEAGIGAINVLASPGVSKAIGAGINTIKKVPSILSKEYNKIATGNSRLTDFGVRPWKSKIDWAKWNKDIPNNKPLMKEYLAIEQQTKQDGTWMKNADGSVFEGTPEQFVQQQSQNFKKAFPEGYKITYRGGKEKNEYPNILFTTKDEFGARSYNQMAHDPPLSLTEAPPEGITQFYMPKTSNKIVIDGNMYPVGHEKYNWGLPYIDDIKGVETWPQEFRRSYSRLNAIDQVPANELEAKNLEAFKNWMLETQPTMQGRGWSGEPRILNDYVMTDDFASFLNSPAGKDISRVEFQKINDGSLKPIDVEVHNLHNQKNLKSMWGNDGMFDMTNPNIYKSLLPIVGTIGVGTAVAASDKDYKKGGYLNNYGVIKDPPVYPSYYTEGLSKRKNLRNLKYKYKKGELVPNPEWQNYLQNNLDPDLLNRWKAEQTTPEENDLVQMALQKRQKLPKYLDKEYKNYAEYEYNFLKDQYKSLGQGGRLKPKNIPMYYDFKGTPIYRDTTSLPFRYGGRMKNNYQDGGLLSRLFRKKNQGIPTSNINIFNSSIPYLDKINYVPSTTSFTPGFEEGPELEAYDKAYDEMLAAKGKTKTTKKELEAEKEKIKKGKETALKLADIATYGDQYSNVFKTKLGPITKEDPLGGTYQVMPTYCMTRTCELERQAGYTTVGDMYLYNKFVPEGSPLKVIPGISSWVSHAKEMGYEKVDPENREPGDVALFTSPGKRSPSQAYHAVKYAGSPSEKALFYNKNRASKYPKAGSFYSDPGSGEEYMFYNKYFSPKDVTHYYRYVGKTPQLQSAYDKAIANYKLEKEELGQTTVPRMKPMTVDRLTPTVNQMGRTYNLDTESPQLIEDQRKYVQNLGNMLNRQRMYGHGGHMYDLFTHGTYANGGNLNNPCPPGYVFYKGECVPEMLPVLDTTITNPISKPFPKKTNIPKGFGYPKSNTIKNFPNVENFPKEGGSSIKSIWDLRRDWTAGPSSGVKLENYRNGGNLIKRADGSYSQRGLWDNIRANKGSGKKPTKEMLEQERKIKKNS